MTDLNTIKEFTEALRATETGTKPYDTTAEVIRTDGNTAWVHIPGGVDETPVQMSIDAKAGDSVNVRVSGGRAWITGNSSRPPTDDAVAHKANATAAEAHEVAEEAQETAEAASQIAQATKNYFWHDADGAHVSTVEGDASTGSNVLIDSDGMDIRDGETVLSSYGADGMAVYAKDSGSQIELAHLGYALGESPTEGTEKAPYYTLGQRESNSIIGNYSVAEGKNVTASGAYSYAEGYRAKATKVYAHAEGAGTTASGSSSHAEGAFTTASGGTSHAEGGYTTASGGYSHAEGYHTTASGNYAHASGFYTTASSYQTVIGKYNDHNSNNAFEIGWGTDETSRANIFEVDTSGNVTAAGDFVGTVPTSRTVNGKALSSNITLDAGDVGAVPTTRKVNNKALSSNITLSASDVGAASSSHTHNSPDGGTTLGSASLSLNTSGWTGATTSFTITSAKLVYIYASARIGGAGLDEATGQTRPRTFLYTSDHARRTPVYFLPAGTYYIYGKGTSSGTVTLEVHELKIG